MISFVIEENKTNRLINKIMQDKAKNEQLYKDLKLEYIRCNRILNIQRAMRIKDQIKKAVITHDTLDNLLKFVNETLS